MNRMKPKKITNLESLRYEQEKLRMQLEHTEENLDKSWGYLKTNYRSMIWKQINPFKNSSILNTALNLVQPGLLPILGEVVKGGIKGNPINLKVLSSSAKYAIATLGIKWLRKFMEKKEDGAGEDTGKDAENTAEAGA
jgi:hypothetical protein